MVRSMTKAILGAGWRQLGGQSVEWRHKINRRFFKMSPTCRRPLDFEIVQSSSELLGKVKPSDSNIGLDDIHFNTGGQLIECNSTWLRDSCHCSQCTHPYSRQRLYQPKNFNPIQFKPISIELTHGGVQEFKVPGDSSDGYIKIRWFDGHVSFYSVSWLACIQELQSQLPDTMLDMNDQKRIRPIESYPRDDFYLPLVDYQLRTDPWTVVKINSSLEPINYQDLLDGFNFSEDNSNYINSNKIESMTKRRLEAIKSLSRQLIQFGIAKVVRVPLTRDQTLNLVKSLAYERPTGYGRVFDVIVEPNTDINLAYSSLEFDLHTDLPYRESSPGVQLLHCIRDSSEGGLSYFSDGLAAAETMRYDNPELFNVLTQFLASFSVIDPYRNVKFRRHEPVLRLDGQSRVKDINYSPFMLPPMGTLNDIKLFYLAYEKFTRLVQSQEMKLITKMKPGDMFVFHNRRVLHGRSGYDAQSNSRFLQGCYMDWDEIECLYEKLHTLKPGQSNN